MGKALWAKNEGDTMNIDFGAKFKKFRKEKGMSIAMLAEKAGVSPGMISQIERNTTVPSIYVFWKLCNALGEKVSVFFEEEEERDKVTLVRAGEHRMVSGSGNQYYLLTPDPKRRIEMYKVVFHREEEQEPVLASHEGAECGYIISGTLRVTTETAEYVLYPGDSIYYESTVLHHLQNNGEEEECVAIWGEVPFTW